jgi:hypothetical protein
VHASHCGVCAVCVRQVLCEAKRKGTAVDQQLALLWRGMGMLWHKGIHLLTYLLTLWRGMGMLWHKGIHLLTYLLTMCWRGMGMLWHKGIHLLTYLLTMWRGMGMLWHKSIDGCRSHNPRTDSHRIRSPRYGAQGIDGCRTPATYSNRMSCPTV